MLLEPDERDSEGGGDKAPFEEGLGASEATRDRGDGDIEGDAESPRSTDAGPEAIGDPSEGEIARDPRSPGISPSGQDSSETGAGVRKPTITQADFERVFRECNANVYLMAKVLGVERSYVRERIAANPQLQALAPDNENSIQQPPTMKKTLVRMPKESIQGRDMVEVVRETEKLIYSGLLAAKVPPETLEVLRSLRGLSVTTGEFLAQSVIDVQDLYTIQLYKIPQQLEWIKTKFLDDDALPGMERMFWQKAYTELLEQLGKGKDRMIAGAEAISVMLKSGEKEGSGRKEKSVNAKPGWGKNNA